MKNMKLLSLLVIVASSLLFVQCTTDPIPGIPGDDGADGLDGMDGVNGTTECATCHNVTTSDAVHASYLFSGHAAGGAVGYAGNRGGCADCHSNEGHIDYLTMGASNPDGYGGMATKISCTTCHNMHTSFDFETDGYDYALRAIDPVTLIVDDSYTIDYEGTSNNCANCHQPRRSGPVDNGLGLFEVTSSHWGPHHGPQSTMLEGIQGMEIAGGVDYPAVADAGHRKGSSCTSCHMGETSGQIDGNHTWIPTPNACTQCHGDTTPGPVTGLQEDMEALLALLEEAHILHMDEAGEVHPVEGTYTILEAEAAWNYLFVYEDASNGVHNPDYAKALIKNSLDALSAN
jgi:hypothetical protein